MTSFVKGTTAEQTEGSAEMQPPEAEAQTKQEVVKVEQPEQPLVSRLKADPQMWKEAINFSEMLSYCRPNGSRTEARFINQYIRPVGITFDKKGNMYKRIGDAPVLWSCHTDTVHSKKGMQKIEYWVDKASGDTFLGVAKGEKSSCLGADDTTGVWIMLEMIRNNVPGLYIFHRGEECGGIGSRWIAANNVEALKGIRFAVAFDRRDQHSIITYQRGTRCCSDDFADSLIDQLGMKHRTDTTGSFTDTASYVDLIAECTNISVGYYDAHCATERVDVDYLFRLRDAICKVDISKLVEKRKPGENTRQYESYTGGSYFDNETGEYSYYGKNERPENGFYSHELNDLYGNWKWVQYFGWSDGWWTPLPGVKLPEPVKNTKGSPQKKDLGVTKVFRGNNGKRRRAYAPHETIAMVKSNPAIVADLLESQGYGPYELKDYIVMAGGFVDEPPPYN